MLRIQFLLIILALAYITRTQSQTNLLPKPENVSSGTLKGKIKDKTSLIPLEYANITVYRKKDSTLAEGSITNSKGQFLITNLPFGYYYAWVSFIGYPTLPLDSIRITASNPDFDFGVIFLEPSFKSLSGVEISEKRSPMEYNLDKKIFNVEQNALTAGGTALDIMETIPAVQVDIEGNVSLRGNTNVLILVDGRPSGLVSLDQLPASMIERVEIVTNPSARYDPDGTTGIINIVLKKQKTPGINGIVNLNAGTGDKYNASANLNYRVGKVNGFASYDYRKFGMKGWNILSRETLLEDSVQYLDQQGDWRRSGDFHNMRLGTDWFLNDRNTLSISGVYNTRGFLHNDQTDNIYMNSRKETTMLTARQSESPSDNKGFETALNYTRKFENKIKELTVDVFYSHSDGKSENQIHQVLLFPGVSGNGNPDSFQQTLSGSDRKALTAQTDYVTPLGPARVETGYKFSYAQNDMDYHLQNFDSDLSLWIEDTSRSNRFIHTEILHSAYFIYSRALSDRWQLQSGIRLEAAHTQADQQTQDSLYSNNAFHFFPTVHLRYRHNEQNQAQLSYSRRVNRPGANVLNPFVNYSDPLNLSAGNPGLKPEFSHSVELGYTRQEGKTTLNPSIFFRNTEGLISRIMTVDSTGVSFSTYRNQDRSVAYGMEIIVTREILKWWRANASFSYFHTRFEGDDVNASAAEDNSWTLRVNTSLSLPKIADFQVGFSYNAPVIFTPSVSGFRAMMGGNQGRLDESYWADFGIRKEILDGRGTLTLRIRDAFKTQKYNITSYGNNFTSISERTRDSRVLFVGFSYKFNDYKQRRQKERDLNPTEEME